MILTNLKSGCSWIAALPRSIGLPALASKTVLERAFQDVEFEAALIRVIRMLIWKPALLRFLNRFIHEKLWALRLTAKAGCALLGEPPFRARAGSLGCS